MDLNNADQRGIEVNKTAIEQSSDSEAFMIKSIFKSINSSLVIADILTSTMPELAESNPPQNYIMEFDNTIIVSQDILTNIASNPYIDNDTVVTAFAILLFRGDINALHNHLNTNDEDTDEVYSDEYINSLAFNIRSFYLVNQAQNDHAGLFKLYNSIKPSDDFIFQLERILYGGGYFTKENTSELSTNFNEEYRIYKEKIESMIVHDRTEPKIRKIGYGEESANQAQIINLINQAAKESNSLESTVLSFIRGLKAYKVKITIEEFEQIAERTNNQKEDISEAISKLIDEGQIEWKDIVGIEDIVNINIPYQDVADFVEFISATYTLDGIIDEIFKKEDNNFMNMSSQVAARELRRMFLSKNSDLKLFSVKVLAQHIEQLEDKRNSDIATISNLFDSLQPNEQLTEKTKTLLDRLLKADESKKSQFHYQAIINAKKELESLKYTN